MHHSSERIKAEEFKDWNEKMVRKYDPDAFHHHPNLFVRFVERKRVKVIFKMMVIHKQDRVLEVGCGAGNVIKKASCGKLFGVDISPFILNKAKKKLNKKVYLFQADAQHLPCKDQAFMQVICSEVLEHLLDPHVALKEIARILKNKGIAIISIPNESLINRIKTLLIHLGIFKWLFQHKGDYQEMPKRMEDEWHLYTFKLEEWLDLFGRYFKVTRLRRIPFFWFPLRYVIRLEK
jgi:ubiquinone/menaquinone biosynthesis C-methylase UbiE